MEMALEVNNLSKQYQGFSLKDSVSVFLYKRREIM